MSLRKSVLLLSGVLGGIFWMGGQPVSSETKNPFSIQNAIQIILETQTGKNLVYQALKQWNLERPKDLIHFLKWGEISKTDAILTRHFNPQTGQETRERQIMIYLRQNQTLEETVLDIAHELVHAIIPPSWDPYDPELTAGKYILATIEAKGGEVDAVLVECQVAIELSKNLKIFLERCKTYLDPQNKGLLREKILEDFYRVGKWSKRIKLKLGNEVSLFPLLSAKKPKLYSSTGGTPYPVALLKEFEEMTEIACENSKRRIHTSPDREPLSETRFLSGRCKPLF